MLAIIVVIVDYRLTANELTQLQAVHRRTRDRREADRSKAVILLASGWRAEDIAEALLVDPNRVRTHFKRYRAGGLDELPGVEYRGSDVLLSDAQRDRLDRHLQEHLYLSRPGTSRGGAKPNSRSATPPAARRPCCIVSGSSTRSPRWFPARRTRRPGAPVSPSTKT
jgi:hypothetical protein